MKRIIPSLLLVTCFIPLSVWAEARTLDVRTLTLDQAYDQVLETDQSIQNAYQEILKARLQPRSALTRLGPSLTGTADYRKSDLTTAGGGSELKDAAITLQQPLLDPTVFAAYRGGKLAAEAAQLTYQATVRAVLFGVAQEYYDVLKQQRIAEVNQQTLDLATQQLNLAQTRFDVGEVAKNDVLRARVAMEQARQLVVQSENLLLLAKHVLASTLNFGSQVTVAVIDPPDYPGAVEEPDVLEQRAYEKREDLRAKHLAVQQSVENQKEIRGQYGPTVAADVSDRWSDPAASESRDTYWQADLSLRMPFLEGGQRSLNLTQAGYQIVQARLAEQSLAKSISVDVKTAWLTVQTLRQTLEALQAQVAAAQENYDSLQSQYQAGAAASLDVLLALTAVTQARSDLASQTYDYQVALRNLELVTGVFQEQRVPGIQAKKASP